MTYPVSNQMLSISEMLEEKATKLRKEEKGKEVLLHWKYYLNIPGQPPNLVLPPEQEPGVIHWKPDETTLAKWKAYRTVSSLRF